MADTYTVVHSSPQINMNLIVGSSTCYTEITTGGNPVYYGYTLSLGISSGSSSSPSSTIPFSTSLSSTCSATGGTSSANKQSMYATGSSISLPSADYLYLYVHCTDPTCDDGYGGDYWHLIKSVYIGNSYTPPTPKTDPTVSISLSKVGDDAIWVNTSWSKGDYSGAKLWYRIYQGSTLIRNVESPDQTFSHEMGHNNLSANTTYTIYAVVKYNNGSEVYDYITASTSGSGGGGGGGDTPTPTLTPPSITSWSCTSRGKNSLSFSGTVDPGDYSVSYGISFDGGAADGASSPYGSYSGLSSGTTYSCTLYVMYGTKGEMIYSTAYGTTLEDTKPTISSVSAYNVTDSSASFSSSWTKGDYSDAYVQYSLDNSSWSTSASRSGLSSNTTYTVYARVVYDGGRSTVGPVSTTFRTSKLPSISGVNVGSITDSSAVLSATGFDKGSYSDAKVQYSINGSTWQDSGTFTGLSSNTNYTAYARVWYNGGSTRSQQTKAFRTLKLPSITGVNVGSITDSSAVLSVTGFDKGDYSDAKVQYSINGTTWQDSGTFTGLSSNTNYTAYARVWFNGGRTRSQQTKAFRTLKVPTITGFSVTKVTGKTATCAATGFDKGDYPDATLQYSKDNTNWQTSNVFSGLTQGTAYTIYCRILFGSTRTTGNRSMGCKTYDIAIDTSTIRTKQYSQKFTVTAGQINGTDQPLPSSVYYSLSPGSISGTQSGYSSDRAVTGLSPNTSYTVSFRCNGSVSQNGTSVDISDTTGSTTVKTYAAPVAADVLGKCVRYSGTTLTVRGTCTQYCPTNKISVFRITPSKSGVSAITPSIASYGEVDAETGKMLITANNAKFQFLNNGDTVTFTIYIQDDEGNTATGTTKLTATTNKVTLSLVSAGTHRLTVKAVVTKDANNPDTDMVNRIRIMFRKIYSGTEEFDPSEFDVINYDGTDYAVFYDSTNSIKFLKGYTYTASTGTIKFTSAERFKYSSARQAVYENTNSFFIPNNTATSFQYMSETNKSKVFEQETWYQAYVYVDNIFADDPTSMNMYCDYDTYAGLNMQTLESFKNLTFTAEATGTTISIDPEWDQNNAGSVIATVKIYKGSTLVDTLTTAPNDQTTKLVSINKDKGTTYTIKLTATDEGGFTSENEVTKTIETYKVKNTDVLNLISTKSIRFNLAITNGLDKTKTIKYLISDSINQSDIVDTTGEVYKPISASNPYMERTGYTHNHSYTIYGYISGMYNQNGKLDTIEAITVTTKELSLAIAQIVDVTQHNAISKWQAYAGPAASREVYDDDPITGDDITFNIDGCYAEPKAESGYQTWNSNKQLYSLAGGNYYVNSPDFSKDKQLTSKVPNSEASRYGELGYYGAYTLHASVSDGVNIANAQAIIHTGFPYTYVYTNIDPTASGGVGIAKYRKAIPYVYTNGSWQKAPVFVCTSDSEGSPAEWKVSNGDDFVQSAPDFVTKR